MRLALAQYRELAAFAQFASDLDAATKAQLDHGERVTELMKQRQYNPLSVAEMAFTLFAADRGYLSEVPVDKVGAFETSLLNFLRNTKQDLLNKINEKGDFNEEIEAQIKTALDEFTNQATW